MSEGMNKGIGKDCDMSEWRECKLVDLGKVITGKTPSKDNPEDWGDDVLFITPSDYRNYGKKACSSLRSLSSVGVERQKNRLLPSFSVLVTCIGSDMGKSVVNVKPCVTNQQINAIIPSNSVTTGDYLYYLTIDLYETLKSLGSDGTAVPILNKTDFENIDVLLPQLPEQNAIAAVLSSLDDKIDLLHRQNQTLEAMAETLFRQWFVVEAQEDWEEVVITSLFEVRDGTHDSPKQKAIGKPLLTSKHILNNRLDIENAYLISEEDFENVNKRSKVDQNDILFSMIGTIGFIYLEQSHTVDYAIKNIGLFKTSQNLDWCYYTYSWLRSSLGQDFIHEHRSGSTQEYISLGSLRNIVFYAPPLGKLNDFNAIISPIFNQIHTLEILRDTLLPKLMSGEVRVKLHE
jgi:type I restriction enzyme, S subunit